MIQVATTVENNFANAFFLGHLAYNVAELSGTLDSGALSAGLLELRTER